MHYAKFIPNTSSLFNPLNKFCSKNIRFKWSAEYEAAFLKAKSVITSNQILVQYDPNLPLWLQTLAFLEF